VLAIVLTNAPPTPVPAQTVEPESSPHPPLEAIVGGIVLLLVLAYVALYWRGLVAADRYAQGFVVERCPVCQHGHLTIEARQDRVLGVPRPRWTVRCDNCRSVLRSAGSRRWRYAVDRAANPTLYNQLNGRVVDEETLKALEQRSPEVPGVRPPTHPPTFIDDDKE
jgi:hypothetical protein